MNVAVAMGAALLLTHAAEASAAVGKRYPFHQCFEIASRLHDVPVDLLLAVAATESNWDADARSTANAHGVMQIQWPGTARHLGVARVAELYNPCLNIELGARYFRELLTLHDGDVDRALAAYNYGPTRIARSPQIPGGAQRYARTVASHRERIGRTLTDGVSVPGAGAAHLLATFSSAARARAYATTLAARVRSATFRAFRTADGAHAVEMRVAEAGLAPGDAALLATLGALEEK